jgi:hypothetical protein
MNQRTSESVQLPAENYIKLPLPRIMHEPVSRSGVILRLREPLSEALWSLSISYTPAVGLEVGFSSTRSSYFNINPAISDQSIASAIASQVQPENGELVLNNVNIFPSGTTYNVPSGNNIEYGVGVNAGLSAPVPEAKGIFLLGSFAVFLLVGCRMADRRGPLAGRCVYSANPALNLHSRDVPIYAVEDESGERDSVGAGPSTLFATDPSRLFRLPVSLPCGHYGLTLGVLVSIASLHTRAIAFSHSCISSSSDRAISVFWS